MVARSNKKVRDRNGISDFFMQLAMCICPLKCHFKYSALRVVLKSISCAHSGDCQAERSRVVLIFLKRRCCGSFIHVDSDMSSPAAERKRKKNIRVQVRNKPKNARGGTVKIPLETDKQSSVSPTSKD